MKLPLYAPSLETALSIIAKGGAEITKQAFDAGAVSPTVDGRYLHWEKLRWKAPPDGLTLDQWWAFIKLARGPGVPIPLRPATPDGFRFKVTLPPQLLQYLAIADQRLRGAPVPTEPHLQLQLSEEQQIAMRMEEAITSSQLEGAATTRLVAQEMLRKARPPRDQGERMIANNYAGMKFVLSIARDSMTPERVLELHRVMTDGTLQDPADSGRLRQRDDVVVVDRYGRDVIHTPPPCTELAARLEAMCDFANARDANNGRGDWIHPILKAVILHFWVGYEHPFVDGNGRTARALFYWLMLRQGYPLAEHISVSQLLNKAQARYVRSYLYTERDENDLTYFALFQLGIINRAIGVLDEFRARRSKEIEALRRKLVKSAPWNTRQVSIIGELLADASATFTPVKLCNTFGVTKPTAIRDLKELEAAGILESAKVKRQLLFSPVPGALKQLKDAN